MSSQPNSNPDAAPWCDKHGCAHERLVWGVSAEHIGGAFSCPKCDAETAARAVAEAGREHDDMRRREAARQKRAALESRIGAACIPARFADYSFDTFPAANDRARTVCQQLRTYANRWQSMKTKGISVLLIGTQGTGKTGLSISVANHVINVENGTAMFMSAYGAVRHQRDTWGRRGRTEREALDDLLAPDLLVLDEVGASTGTDGETAMLFEVLNGRYAERKPTILLSNLPMEDYESPTGKRPGLRTTLGPRVIDRFRDDGGFTVACDWPSLRGVRA